MTHLGNTDDVLADAQRPKMTGQPQSSQQVVARLCEVLGLPVDTNANTVLEELSLVTPILFVRLSDSLTKPHQERAMLMLDALHKMMKRFEAECRRLRHQQSNSTIAVARATSLQLVGDILDALTKDVEVADDFNS